VIGAHAVDVYAATDGLTFLAEPKSGAVQMTTINSAGKSVHSRYVILGVAPIPSQRYGTCLAR